MKQASAMSILIALVLLPVIGGDKPKRTPPDISLKDKGGGVPNLSDVLERIRPSIFQLSVGSSKVPGAMVLGTAFFVEGGGIAVTALHVIRDAEMIRNSDPSAKLIARIPSPNVRSKNINMFATFVVCDVVLLGKDEVHDLALLRVSLPTKWPIQVPGVTDRFVVGAPVTLPPSLPREAAYCYFWLSFLGTCACNNSGHSRLHLGRYIIDTGQVIRCHACRPDQ